MYVRFEETINKYIEVESPFDDFCEEVIFNENGDVTSPIDYKVQLAEELKFINAKKLIYEAYKYLESTSWIWEKYSRNVLVLKSMTSDEFYVKYKAIIDKQEEARNTINEK